MAGKASGPRHQFLLYVYPLKVLAEVVTDRLLWTSNDEVDAMNAEEMRGLYLIFGAAVVAASIAMASLYLRAWQTRTIGSPLVELLRQRHA